MTFDMRVDLTELRRVPFLSSLAREEAEALCSAGELRECASGSTIFRQGDPGQELFVILDGEVAIELESAHAGNRLLAALQQGTVFGEINFLVGSERTATARALRDTRVLVFRRDNVDALDGLGKQAASIMIETLARVLALRLANMNREMTTLREQLEVVLDDVSHDMREWRAQHAAVSHLASELRDWADKAGEGMGHLAALVRDADQQRQTLLHSWHF